MSKRAFEVLMTFLLVLIVLLGARAIYQRSQVEHDTPRPQPSTTAHS